MPAVTPTHLFVATAGVVALAALTLVSVWRMDVLIYNGTSSMPVGFYLRTSAQVGKTSIVTVRAVDVAPDYSAKRNFTDLGDRFLKRVAGAAGDVVCADGSVITLNGAVAGVRAMRDASGQKLPTWTGCVTLDASHVLLLGETADSFDGRYWGPTPVEAIEGVWRRLD